MVIRGKEINAVINGNNNKKIEERKGKKNGRKINSIYIYIYKIRIGYEYD